MIKKDDIINLIKTCYDPEIPIDLWNLGLIYKIKINQKQKNVTILMTLTTPGCGMATYIADDVKQKILTIDEIVEVIVDITFDPAWSPKMMTDEGKTKLGFKPKNTEKNWE